MRVKMKVSISGTRDGISGWPAYGGEIDLPDAEGKDLVAVGMAEEVKKAAKKAEPKAEPKVETATDEEPEPEKATGLTTGNGPVKRGPGRPRKNP